LPEFDHYLALQALQAVLNILTEHEFQDTLKLWQKRWEIMHLNVMNPLFVTTKLFTLSVQYSNLMKILQIFQTWRPINGNISTIIEKTLGHFSSL
jgi:hypothetical protein